MESDDESEDENEHDKRKALFPFAQVMASRFRTNTLHEAVTRGREDLVIQFLEQRVDPMKKANDNWDTAVHMAAARGKSDIMRLLLGFDGAGKLDFSSAKDRAKAIPHIEVTNKEGDTPLHIAAQHGHGTIVHLLLSLFVAEDIDADPDAIFARELAEKAWSEAMKIVMQKNKREETPLHIAAWCGNSYAMEALLGLTDAKESFESAVSKCADTALKAHRKDRTRLAKPRHALGTQSGEKNAAKQDEREHHWRNLFDAKDIDKRTPLELMARGRRCPEDDVCWFVTCYCASQSSVLSENKRAKEDFEKAEKEVRRVLRKIMKRFLEVAKGFPVAASNLLQIANESGEGEEFGEFGAIDPRYLRCLREAFTEDSPKNHLLKKFSRLVRTAPQAASIVLDVVTYTPDEPDPHRDPMPRRFIPPRNDLYPLTCTYEDEKAWVSEKGCDPPEWHERLINGVDSFGMFQTCRDRCVDRAEDCSSNFVACALYVVHLDGLAEPDVLNGLAGLSDDSMFTKLQVLALLQFVWQQFRCLFIQDMVYEGIAIIVLSRWTFDPLSTVFESSVNSSFASRLSWTLVAGQGVLEAIILLWTALRHLELEQDGWLAMLKWAMRNAHRMILSALTIGLAIASTEDHWPGMGNNMNVALGTTSLWHWLTMLYKIRAFVKTGTRLLPIMKTITPMSGMLVILAFLLVGIIHVFWAWERGTFEQASTWKFLTFLFIGDNFITDKFMLDNDMSTSRQWFLMILGGSSVFVFTCWTLNLFIAVLSEVYEQEQERMLVTFLRERACICSFLRLRPQLPFPKLWRIGYLNGAGSSHGWVEAIGLLLISASSIVTATSVCMLLEISNWPAAIILAFWAVLQQALMHNDLSKGWDKKYLWYCSDTSGAEELFSLGHRPQDKMFPQSRAWKLKGYITEVLSKLEKQDNVIARLDVEMTELKGKTDKIDVETRGLEKKTSNIFRSVGGKEVGCIDASSQTSRPVDVPQEATCDDEGVFERECSRTSEQVDEAQKAATGSPPKAKKKAKAKTKKPPEPSAMGTDGS